jgi:hypothetical protein
MPYLNLWTITITLTVALASLILFAALSSLLFFAAT